MLSPVPLSPLSPASPLISPFAVLLVAGVIGLLDVLVGRRFGVLELADLVVGAADLRARLVVALLARLGFALGFLVEVRLLRARLFRDVAVLVARELRVVGRLVLDVLVVLDLDHRHVRRRLHRRRLLRLLGGGGGGGGSCGRRLQLLRRRERDLDGLSSSFSASIGGGGALTLGRRDQLVDVRVGERDLRLASGFFAKSAETSVSALIVNVQS